MPCLLCLPALLAALLLAASPITPATAQVECPTLTNNMVAACEAVSTKLWGPTLPPLRYAAAGTTCAVLAVGVEEVYGAEPVVPACCEAVRAFATAGCVCNQDVIDMTEGMGRLPAGTDVPLFMQGIMHLTQGSKCAWAAYGGPILDACSGTLGPCEGATVPEPASI